jgi:RNA polymerase sigma-70 factor (ECF subfamily)
MADAAPGPTELLLAWGRGEKAALDELVPIVHRELMRMARRFMAGERPHQTIQATALVNEAYLRLIQIDRVKWQNRAHFFAVAARLMRRILVDAARARGKDKRGGAMPKLSLDEALIPAEERGSDLVALDDARQALSASYPRHGDVVELRFFGGLTLDETAEALGVSRDTVKRDWRFAKLWIVREMKRPS